MLFLQTIVNVLWTGRSQCDLKVVQHVCLKKDFYTRLWNPLCTAVDFHHSHSDCLTSSMHCISMHTKLSPNILKQTLGDSTSLKDCWSHRFLFSLSYHAGLSPINNLCNILSQSVHSDSLMATGIQITIALKLFLWLYSLDYAFSLSEWHICKKALKLHCFHV